LVKILLNCEQSERTAELVRSSWQVRPERDQVAEAPRLVGGFCPQYRKQSLIISVNISNDLDLHLIFQGFWNARTSVYRLRFS
jgi:hypothetical protein